MTGIGRFAFLEKLDAKQSLTTEETTEFGRLQARFKAICSLAAELKVRLLVDAEESWIQDTIDDMTTEAMALYNKERVIIYNTLQMYRHDRLAFLEKDMELARSRNFKLGYKIVRGVPIWKKKGHVLSKKVFGLQYNLTKQRATAVIYNGALVTCVDHADIISICAGSHNEESNQLLVKLIEQERVCSR